MPRASEARNFCAGPFTNRHFVRKALVCDRNDRSPQGIDAAFGVKFVQRVATLRGCGNWRDPTELTRMEWSTSDPDERCVPGSERCRRTKRRSAFRCHVARALPGSLFLDCRDAGGGPSRMRPEAPRRSHGAEKYRPALHPALIKPIAGSTRAACRPNHRVRDRFDPEQPLLHCLSLASNCNQQEVTVAETRK